MSEPRAASGRVAPLLPLVFSSGAGALAFEALWFRQARLAFGSTVWASAAVTGAFMLGIALGGAVIARARLGARAALLVYAALELVVALAGYALVRALPSLSLVLAPFAHDHASLPLLVESVSFLYALLLLALPSAAMGMTLPLAARALSRDADEPGGRVGGALALLYGVNTLGATVGTLSIELALLDVLGVHGCALAAAGMSALAALLALLRARRTPAASRSTRAFTEVEEYAGSARSFGRLLAAALAGMAMLGLEVVWLRLLLLFLSDTPTAFAVILATVLASIAGGSLLASLWLARDANASRHADLVALAGGASVTLALLAFPRLLAHFFTLEQDAWTVAAIALPLVLPTSLASGALFPLLIAGSRGPALRATAQVTWANTLGGALGSTLAALVILPHLGMERGFLLCALALGAAGVVLRVGGRSRRPLRAGAIAAYVTVLCFFPFGAIERTFVRGSVARWMGPEDRLLEVREARDATLALVRHRRDQLDVYDQLATNSYSMSADDFAARRYMKLFVYLPAALHPNMSRALAIGYGLGSTVEALVERRELDRIDVVDISPETLALSRLRARSSADHPLDDPRIALHVADGRHFLAGTAERYDLITGEPPPPFLAGVESLYSREYFELVHARLREGGFATYWLPIINISADGACAIVQAFCTAFDSCSLWHGAGPNYMLVGRRGRAATVPLDRYVAPWTDPRSAQELRAIGLEHPVQLGGLFIGDRPYLNAACSDVDPLSDDFPRALASHGSPEMRAARDRLITALRDTAAARDRFRASPLVASLLPARALRDSLGQFEHQRLVDDLLWNNENARTLSVLDQVLRHTPWQLPVLLLLDSDPDVQRALARKPAAHDEPPAWRVHRLAGALAARDYGAALEHARAIAPERLPLPDLTTYLERALGAELTRTR